MSTEPTYLWELYGISIAAAVRFLDLSVRLIPLGLLKAGGQGSSIALTIRSLDPTLQMYKVELKE